MDGKHKQELERMIKENDTKDQTESIRERGHSGLLRDNILQFYKISYYDFHMSCSYFGLILTY